MEMGVSKIKEGDDASRSSEEGGLNRVRGNSNDSVCVSRFPTANQSRVKPLEPLLRNHLYDVV